MTLADLVVTSVPDEAPEEEECLTLADLMRTSVPDTDPHPYPATFNRAPGAEREERLRRGVSTTTAVNSYFEPASLMASVFAADKKQQPRHVVVSRPDMSSARMLRS
jgi:hypothetical protein